MSCTQPQHVSVVDGRCRGGLLDTLNLASSIQLLGDQVVASSIQLLGDQVAQIQLLGDRSPWTESSPSRCALSFAQRVAHGLLAVGLGAFLEGESVLLIAGAAASRGHLWLPAVVAVAALASFVGDQFYFSLGRKYGKTLLARFPALAPRAARVDALLARWHLPLILSIRFLYGLRVAGPFAVGMSSVPWSRFLALNLAGAWLWAWLVAAAGYFGGQLLGHALAAVFTGNDEADHGPYWLVVHGLHDGRTPQSPVFLAWRQCDPADGRLAAIADEAGNTAAFNQCLHYNTIASIAIILSNHKILSNIHQTTCQIS